MREPIDQYIIDSVRAIRKKSKKSQMDIAHALDFESIGYIGAIESMAPERTECYNNKQLNTLAKFLHCSVKNFFPELYIEKYSSPRKRLPHKQK